VNTAGACNKKNGLEHLEEMTENRIVKLLLDINRKLKLVAGKRIEVTEAEPRS
jgi:hypothetical protein